MTEYIQTFRYGMVTVTAISVGNLRLDLAGSFAIPQNEWSPRYDTVFKEPLVFPVQCFLIQQPNRTTLVDASLYDIRPTSPFYLPDYQPPPGLLERLAEIEVSPESIDQVIITHLHFDHFNGTTIEQNGRFEPCFPQARHYIGRADWESAETQKGLQKTTGLAARTLGVLQQHRLVELVDEQLEISDGLQIMAAPGETPGHQIVRLAVEDKTLYFLGDLVHHPVEFEQPKWTVQWGDSEANLASRQRLIAAALVEEALLFATHISGAGRLRGSGSEVVWEEI